jgi:uncharacterized membrane protein
MRALATAAACLVLAAGCEPAESEPTPDVAPTGCGEDVPELDWEGFGHGFVTTYCQGCHASSAMDRHGAPEHVVFDTEADVMVWSARVLATAGGDVPTMPPGGGPDEEDRELLEVWLGCAE